MKHWPIYLHIVVSLFMFLLQFLPLDALSGVVDVTVDGTLTAAQRAAAVAETAANGEPGGASDANVDADKAKKSITDNLFGFLKLLRDDSLFRAGVWAISGGVCLVECYQQKYPLPLIKNN